MTEWQADVDYTWRDSELRSAPLRALNRVGDGLGRVPDTGLGEEFRDYTERHRIRTGSHPPVGPSDG